MFLSYSYKELVLNLSVEIEPSVRTITLTSIAITHAKLLTKETEYGAEH